MKKIIKKVTTLVITALAFVVLAACGNGQAEQTVKLGRVGADNDVWDTVKKRLKEDENINLEYVTFTEYSQPNRALAEGEIDLNAFQTIQYLENSNKEFGTDLISIGNTLIAPMGIYTNKYNSLEEIPDGAEISIPNDVINTGRALYVLEAAGLITLNDDVEASPEVEDIKDNPKNLTITPLDASQISRSLDDVDAGLINSGFAVDAGLDPVNDPIFIEPVNERSKNFVNIIAARKEDEDNPLYQKVVDYYQTEETKQAIIELDKGASIPAWEDYGRK